ncbi:recombination regulator RecX [Priestia taiwanensis]|uniref:Regulatory protein RecX n=1 Tax=Priestia taiwanensis TaxID=1347902 RepID=A0A917AWQ9_9BACI|nr:recombination regulator RecX [Priestia taiwanensis]MBM7364635.1 regulatory protein [Priestia taiwanensis]GGE78398.1 regulatory protein RecX [Priestia taiwanensis]
MIITKIEVQQKNKERFNIYVNRGSGEEYGFSIDQNTLIEYNLKSGMELDELAITEVFFFEEKRSAYLKAINYLSYGMRTEKEVYDYLLKKEIPQEVIREVIQTLLEQRYLNDVEYAKAYVQTHSHVSAKGPHVIARTLRTKGIGAETVTAILHEYSDDKQVENAVKLCQKKLKSYAKLSLKEKKQKLEIMLRTKGYPYSVSSAALEELEWTDDEDEQHEALLYQARKYHQKYRKFEGYVYENKMKQALYRKGFTIEMIDSILEELREEEE